MVPVGVCKASVVPFVNIALIMKICVRISYRGSASPFQSCGSLVLYADRSRSPGRLPPLLVCQVACRGQGQEVSGLRYSKSS